MGVPEDRRQEVVSAIAAIRRPAALRRQSPMTRATQLCRVYVGDIGRQPLGELKTHLKTIHFVLTKIRNISFVGATTAEFLVACDYRSRFYREIESFRLGRVLRDYDPARAHDPSASEDIRKRVHQAFCARVRWLAENSVHSDVVQYFKE